MSTETTDLAQQKYTIAQTFSFKAYRCFYLAESYTVMKKWLEGMALLDRAMEHIVQANEYYREWGHTEAEVFINPLYFIIIYEVLW